MTYPTPVINPIPSLLAIRAMNNNIFESKEDDCLHLPLQPWCCILPDDEFFKGQVIEISDIWYEKETKNVILKRKDRIYTWFCLPEEEYYAQLSLLVKTGFCDFNKRLVNTTEENLRNMTQNKPICVKKEEAEEKIGIGFICAVCAAAIAMIIRAILC